MSESLPDRVSDANWPEILSLSSHEVRTPLTPLMGYLRMMLQQAAGPLSEPQRQMLEAVQRSCGQISTVLNELSELAQVEKRGLRIGCTTVDLPGIFAEAIATLPALPDREVSIALSGIASIAMHGNAARLRTSFGALLHALRREAVGESLEVRVESAGGIVRVTIAEPARLAKVCELTPSILVTFDEWKRGGIGLSLPIARRVIEAHGGRLLGPPDDKKASAIVLLPVP